MSRSSIAPRRQCSCGRHIAIVAGCFARHDPVKPRRRKRGARTERPRVLVSCPGSLTPAPVLDLPDRAGTQSLFEYLSQGPLAGASPSTPTLEQEFEQMRADLLRHV